MSDLASIEKKDLLQHYRTYYSPGNAFIVVAGDVRADKLIDKIREHFAGIELGPERRPHGSTEPTQKGERRVYLRKEAELPYVLAAYHVPAFPEEDSYPLEVLAEVLTGKSGRLYRELVYERKIALNADVGYSGMYGDSFLFFLDATASPGIDIEVVEKALYKEVEALAGEPPSERELQRAKNRLEASFIMGQDSMFNQAMQLGLHEIIGDWRLMDRYVDEIRKVTAEDVSRAAAKYLSRDNRTVGILIPRKRTAE
jgi:zinc protease